MAPVTRDEDHVVVGLERLVDGIEVLHLDPPRVRAQVVAGEQRRVFEGEKSQVSVQGAHQGLAIGRREGAAECLAQIAQGLFTQKTKSI